MDIVLSDMNIDGRMQRGLVVLWETRGWKQRLPLPEQRRAKQLGTLTSGCCPMNERKPTLKVYVKTKIDALIRMDRNELRA